MNIRDMKKRNQSTSVDPGVVYYEIKVQGELDPQRSKWFEGMTLTHIENGESGLACTLIAGWVSDQPALYGLLTKLRDLNLTLISVRRSLPGLPPEANHETL